MEAASPIKGLERISEELRLERQKANYALQEKARIRVEIESYKQTIEQQKELIEDLERKCDGLVNQVNELDQRCQCTRAENNQTQNALQESKNTIANLETSLENANSEIQNCRQQILDRDNDIHELRIRMETLDKKSQTKDELIQSLKDELLSVRKSQMAFEEEKEQVYTRLNQQSALNQELQAQLQLIGAKESGYHETVESNSELRDALEKTLLLNTALNDQVRDLQSHLNEKVSQEHSLYQESAHLHNMRSQLLEEITHLQAEHEVTVSRLDAEIDAKLAAQEKADAAVKNRMFLESQMMTMRAAYEEALSTSANLEREIANQKQTIGDLQEQIIQLRDKETQLETLQRQVSNQQAVSLELETLRTQLQVMRKKLVKKDLEEEAQLVAPRALLEREQQGRLVYEGIIADLRKEVDRVTSLYHDAVHRCDELTLQASRVEGLQEEIELYKETAKAISQESQTMALTASEVAERSVKATHERHSMLQALQSSQTALHSTQAEVERNQKEIQELKDKVKQYHAAKLQADKRVTEISAINARLEASMETFQQQFDNQTIALEEGKRQLQDMQRQFNDFQRQHADCEQVKKEYDTLKLQSHFSGQDTNNKLLDLERLLEAKQVEKELLQSELSTLKEKLNVQKASVDHLQQELLMARRNYDEAHLQCERYRMDAESTARHAQHQEIVSLQDELKRTMSEWSALEKEQSAKDQLIEQLRVDYGREKERAMLLKMQVSLLEEKLQVVTQEVQVYRGIDVYHAAKQAELMTTANHNNNNNNNNNGKNNAENNSNNNNSDKLKNERESRDEDDDDEEDDDDFFSGRKSLRPSSATFPSGTNSSRSVSQSHRLTLSGPASPQRQTSRLSLAEITSTNNSLNSTSKALGSSLKSTGFHRKTASHQLDTDDSYKNNTNNNDYFFSSEMKSQPFRSSSPPSSSSSSSNYYQRAMSASRLSAPNDYNNSNDSNFNNHHNNVNNSSVNINAAGDDLLSRAELMRERQMRRLERERALRAQILSEEKSQRLSSSGYGYTSLMSSGAGFRTPVSSSAPLSSSTSNANNNSSSALASAARSAKMDLDRARRLLAI